MDETQKGTGTEGQQKPHTIRGSSKSTSKPVSDYGPPSEHQEAPARTGAETKASRNRGYRNGTSKGFQKKQEPSGCRNPILMELNINRKPWRKSWCRSFDASPHGTTQLIEHVQYYVPQIWGCRD